MSVSRRVLVAAARTVAAAVFPSKCAACGALGAGICATCLARARPLDVPNCRQCNRPLEYGDQCAACRAERRRVDRVFVRYPYVTPLREAVQRLKYENRRYLARELAAIAVTALPDDLSIDAILPIPLHPQRQAERGYNQSALLAANVAELLEIPLDDRLLRRERATRTQMSLPRRERLGNLRGAFRATQTLSGRRLLLVDDVTTTGATLEAAVRALRRRGSAWVGALVVARQPLGLQSPARGPAPALD